METGARRLSPFSLADSAGSRQSDSPSRRRLGQPSECHRPTLSTRDLGLRRPDPVEEHLPERRVPSFHALDGDAAETLEGVVLIEGVPERRDKPGARVQRTTGAGRGAG